MKLRSHLLILTVATLLPLVVFAVVASVLFARQERSTFERGAIERTRALLTAIDTELRSSVTVLEAMATSPELRSGDLRTFHDEMTRTLTSQPDWFTIELALPSGEEVVNALRRFGAELPVVGERRSLEEAVRTGRPAVGDIVVGPITAEHEFSVRVPVVRGGDIKYVLSAVVRPASIAALLAAQRLPADWVGVVVDGNKRIVARTVDPERMLGRPASESLQAAIDRTSEGWFQGGTIEGVNVYSPYTRSAFSGWTVALGIPAPVVRAGVWRTGWALSAGMIAAAVLAGGLAVALGRRISAPIVDLAGAAHALGRGDRPAIPRTISVDEVEAVGRALEDASAAIRAKEATQGELAAIVEGAADAMIGFDLDGNVRTWNPAATRLYGYTAGEVIGRHVSFLVPSDRMHEPNEVFPAVARGELRAVETVRLRKDLTAVEVAVRVSPVRDAAGNVTGFSSMVRDITEQKRAARALAAARDELARQVDNLERLRDRERRAREAAESLAAVARTINTLEIDATLGNVTESACTLLRADVAALYRVDPVSGDMTLAAAGGALAPTLNRDVTVPSGTGLVGLAVERREAVVSGDLLGDERIAHSPSMRARIQAARHRVGLAVPLIVQARIIGALFVGALPGRAFSPEEVHLARTFADQAAVAMANAELYGEAQRANRLKDEFLAMLGHELRNPLGAIAGAVGVFKMAGGRTDVFERAREVIERQVRHLSRLVDDLLDIGRVTTGKVRLDRRPLDLEALVVGAMEAWRAAGRFARHRVSLQTVRVTVDGDATRLEQILENLVGNALKYTPAGGAIGVRLAVEAGTVVLEVADTGAGIPAGLGSRMFDLFVQGDRPLDRAQGGLGIGLTLVKALAGLHGGTVEARSPGSGQGSVFTVRLPRLPVPAELPAAPRVASEPATQWHRRILVIEDNDDARDMLRTALTLAGHEVHEAADGRAGLDLVQAIAPDVALIDVGLPGLDGYEVVRRIRAREGGDAIVLVAITGYGQAEDRRRAADAGFDAHVTKPVLPDRLTELIAGLHRPAAR